MSLARIGTRAPARGAEKKRFLRWRLVNDWREQLRKSGLGVSFVAVMLVFVNVVLYLRRGFIRDAVGHADPDTLAALEAAHEADAVFTLAISAVFLVGYALVKVIETHRVEGPQVALLRRIQEIEKGRYRGLAQLRKDDHLKPLASAVNSMIVAMRDRSRAEVKELEELSKRARRIDSQYAAKDVSDRILALADTMRRRFE